MAALVLAVVATLLPATAASAASAPILYTTSRHAGTREGGSEVWLYGSDIGTATSVRFGDTPATSFYESFGSLNVITPAHAVGDVPIIVETPLGTSSAVMTPQTTYTFTEPGVPVIANMSPYDHQGPEIGTTVVDLYGYDLGSATGVRFGDTPAASIFSIAPTQIRVIAPVHAPGTVNVTIDTPFGPSPPTIESRYTFTPQPPPTLQYVAPRTISVAGGSTVSIVGVGFTNATRVQFGAGNDATSFSVYDDAHITAVAPPAPTPNAGYLNVFVTTPKGTTIATSASMIAYVAPPAITSLTPNRGSTAGGDAITINGSRLGGVTMVEIDGIAASFTIESGSKIVAVAPPHAAGTVHVQVWSLNGYSAPSLSTLFTYDEAGAPVISSTSPNTGPIAAGGTVILTGTGFTGATAVTVGGTAASFTVVSPTRIDLVVPPRASAGLVNVQVRRNLAVNSPGPSSWYRYT